MNDRPDYFIMFTFGSQGEGKSIHFTPATPYVSDVLQTRKLTLLEFWSVFIALKQVWKNNYK